MSHKTKLVLVDAPALTHRAFHALPHLTTKSGLPVNAIYGFCMIFLKMLKDLKPDFVITAFDLKAPTWRHKEFKEYKAKRVKAPQEYYDQLPKIKEILGAFRVPVFELAGFEADDIIGTIAQKARNQVDEIIIVTGDLDTLQLVNEKTKIYTLKRGLTDTIIYDENSVQKRYGLKPDQMNDFKGLRGDASDNIPGISGIGEKTAAELVAKYGSIEKIYQNFSQLPPKIQRLLAGKKDDAEFSKKLATIRTDLPLEFNLKKSSLENYDRSRVVQIFQELGFKSLLTKLPKFAPANQETLFGKSQPEAKSSKKTQGDYQIIQSEKELQKLINNLEKQPGFVIDTETDRLDAISGTIIGLSICYQEKQAFYLPLPTDQERKRLLSQLKPILENQSVEKYGHNLKYDYLILKKYGIDLKPIIFDTMIASYLLNPNTRAHNLDQVAFVELGYEKISIQDIIGKGAKQKLLSQVPLKKVAEYSCEDADISFRLVKHFKPQLTGNLKKLFYEIEMPLVRILADMEYEGIKLDTNHLQKLLVKVNQKITLLKKKIYQLAGTEFNINSTQQLRHILFEKLKISTAEIKKTKTGRSTAASELEKLRGTHKIIDYISQYREMTKLKNTYLEALPKLVNPQTGRLHTSYNQTTTATGRLSSSDPNLQNIPIRTETGQEIRKAFVADKGFKILSADYSQIELRIIAHLSNDLKMLEAFEKGEDIHAATASEIFGLPLAKITPKMRRIAKTVNFGILYGISPYGLAQGLNIKQKQAKQFIENYFESFKGVKRYIKETIAKAREIGYVETLLGRRRYLPEIHSQIPQVRNAAERMAINMPCQGTAADIMKIAMIEIKSKINPDAKGSGLRPKRRRTQNTKLLLQVHDELVFEVPENEVKKIAKQVKAIMENVFKLKVPLKVDIKVGNNWQEMSAVNI